jgi:hypothetical protein
MRDDRARVPFAAVVLAMLVGCGDPDAGRCSVESKSGACLTVVSLEGFDGASGLSTTNVDAFRDTCVVADPANPGETKVIAEPFTDHAVRITIDNAPPLDVAELAAAPAVTLDGWEVDYRLNDCSPDPTVPSAIVACPALAPIVLEPGPSVTILGNTRATVTVPLVPLRKKLEYRDKLGLQGAVPSYTAEYVIHGKDADGKVQLKGSIEFTIGDFNNCPE